MIMPEDQDAAAVARLCEDLRETFIRLMGKEPDPQAVKDEAEELVTRYGPAAQLSDLLA
jgi:hypothetical protein